VRLAATAQPVRLREPLAFLRMMVRYWLTIHPLMRADLEDWRARATAIPDATLRADALATLAGERLNTAGAALFASFTGNADPALLRALIAFQVTWDYVDTLSERPADDPIANGAQLHAALVDALTPGGERADYYRLHAHDDDGGYLAALVDACRDGCATLPRYAAVGETARSEASRAAVQGINHSPADGREPAMRRWAAEQAHASDVHWFELAAAASSSLAIHALLAAAADRTTTPSAAQQISAAYFPWVCALSTLLDSLVDEADDAGSGEISFIGHYRSRADALGRLRTISERAFAEARRLPSGEQHAVIIAGMVAMYLSKASAWTAAARPLTIAVLRASSLTVLPLLVLMRSWRSIRRN
jgi:tetraprenyl-beta-curcumene synthase